jgi:hypothetical protein
MAPGRISPEPPPTSATGVTEWCGSAKGGRVMSPFNACPASECTADTSTDSSTVRSGRIDGSREASIVFPTPGGPLRKR